MHIRMQIRIHLNDMHYLLIGKKTLTCQFSVAMLRYLN